MLFKYLYFHVLYVSYCIYLYFVFVLLDNINIQSYYNRFVNRTDSGVQCVFKLTALGTYVLDPEASNVTIMI